MTNQSFDSILAGSPAAAHAEVRIDRVRRSSVRSSARPVVWGFWAVLSAAVLVVVGSTSVTGASAYWAAGSAPGGSATVSAASLPVGPTPTVTATGSSIIVRWSAVTFSDGTAVSGYTVKRYISGGAAQTINTDCAGSMVNLGCIEQLVPAGTWQYTVTPIYATSWAGAESPLSAAISTTATVPTNNVWVWVTP